VIGLFVRHHQQRKLVEELRMHLAWRMVYAWVSIRRFRTTPRSRRIGRKIPGVEAVRTTVLSDLARAGQAGLVRGDNLSVMAAS